MNELVEEHIYGRKLVSELVDAKQKYVQALPFNRMINQFLILTQLRA